MRSIFFLFFLSFSYAVSAQQFDNPIDYFDFINEQHSQLSAKNLEYIQYAVHSGNVNVVEQKRVEVVKQLAQAVISVAALPAYEGDDGMRQKLADVLEVYLESFEIELSELNILKDKSLASFEAMEQYFEAQAAVEKKMGDAGDSFMESQHAFAKRHNIILQQAEENSTIAQINKVNDYYRAVFLRYFKITKLNAAFMDNMETKDATLLEKNRLELAKEAAIEIKKLTHFPAFKGDTEFRDAALDLLKYYQKLAKKDYQVLVMVTKKGDAQLTQKDVDAFNKVVSDYNTQVQAKTNAYNRALDNLLKNNVPKPGIQTKRL